MSEGIFPFGLYIGTSFTPRPLYLPGKDPQYQLERRPVTPQSRSGRCEEEKNVLPIPISQLASPYRIQTDNATTTTTTTTDDDDDDDTL
jgi:hypothetical protein